MLIYATHVTIHSSCYACRVLLCSLTLFYFSMKRLVGNVKAFLFLHVYHFHATLFELSFKMYRENIEDSERMGNKSSYGDLF